MTQVRSEENRITPVRRVKTCGTLMREKKDLDTNLPGYAENST